jgi:hypothetical protein
VYLGYISLLDARQIGKMYSIKIKQRNETKELRSILEVAARVTEYYIGELAWKFILKFMYSYYLYIFAISGDTTLALAANKKVHFPRGKMSRS